MNKIISKSSGITSGLGITSFFSSIFEANELLPPKQRMTDEVIAKKVAKEFPNRPSAQDFISSPSSHKQTVNRYRRMYNRGKFTKDIPPELPSFRYNKDGLVVNYKTGTICLAQEQINFIIEEHKQLRENTLRNML